jgi:hypothetical protein
MLNITQLIDLVLSLRESISEPARSEVAHKLADRISNVLQKGDNSEYRAWIKADRFKFLQQCELVDTHTWIKDSLHIEASKLKNFCTKWTTTNILGGRVITPEMNRLRVAMVKELVAISLDN